MRSSLVLSNVGLLALMLLPKFRDKKSEVQQISLKPQDAFIEDVSDAHERGAKMLSWTILPFKLEASDEVLNALASLALLGEFAHALGLKR